MSTVYVERTVWCFFFLVLPVCVGFCFTLSPVKTQETCCMAAATEPLHMPLYTHTHSPLQQWKRPLQQVLADVLSLSGFSLRVVWFFSGLYLKWLRYLRLWRDFQCLANGRDGHLMPTFLAAKSSWSCWRALEGHYQLFVYELTGLSGWLVMQEEE